MLPIEKSVERLKSDRQLIYEDLLKIFKSVISIKDNYPVEVTFAK